MALASEYISDSVCNFRTGVNIFNIGVEVQSFWLGCHQCKMSNGRDIMILINTWIEKFNFQNAATLIIPNRFYVGWHHILSLHGVSPSLSNSEQDRHFKKSLCSKEIAQQPSYLTVDTIISGSPIPWFPHVGRHPLSFRHTRKRMHSAWRSLGEPHAQHLTYHDHCDYTTWIFDRFHRTPCGSFDHRNTVNSSILQVKDLIEYVPGKRWGSPSSIEAISGGGEAGNQ